MKPYYYLDGEKKFIGFIIFDKDFGVTGAILDGPTEKDDKLISIFDHGIESTIFDEELEKNIIWEEEK